MKKLVYIIVILFLIVSCSKVDKPSSKKKVEKPHVYSTYYGDIDIDTMKVSMWADNIYPCYRVKVIERDSIFIGHIVKYLPCPQEILYCPKKNCYYKLEPALHDETAVYEFDPTFDYHNQ